MGPTIRDVAEAAGVGVSTVSRVLNNAPGVNKTTRKKVLAAVDALGFIPNAMARSLSTKKSGIIGVVVANLTNPFFPEVIRGIEECVSPLGYNIILCSTEFRPEKELAYTNILIRKQVEGVIFASLCNQSEAPKILSSRGIPSVMAASYFPWVNADYTVVDNVLGGTIAGRHLVKLGHRKIAYVSGPPDTATHKDRLAGLRQALLQANLDIPPEYIIYGSNTEKSGYEAGRRLLSLKNRPSAIFAGNDLMAIGVLDAANEMGIDVPVELAVIGFDDISFAALSIIQLTTIAQPRYDMGMRAGQMLVERIEAKDLQKPPRGVVLAPRLVVRKTCGFYLQAGMAVSGLAEEARIYS